MDFGGQRSLSPHKNMYLHKPWTNVTKMSHRIKWWSNDISYPKGQLYCGIMMFHENTFWTWWCSTRTYLSFNSVTQKQRGRLWPYFTFCQLLYGVIFAYTVSLLNVEILEFIANHVLTEAAWLAKHVTTDKEFDKLTGFADTELRVIVIAPCD